MEEAGMLVELSVVEQRYRIVLAVLEDHLEVDTRSDRLAAQTLIFAAGTFLLAALAGGLALYALSEAQRRPQPSAWFTFDDAHREYAEPQRQIEARQATS